ncbi:MAG: SIR2 family protein [Candidatus Electrothrix sp. GW3-4]|uniref:SIR2 family protein n=1 Tax=Candidatus Electrothrix sp. GW3-4 TaxID=3126740 RepID=UPI0030CF8731
MKQQRCWQRPQTEYLDLLFKELEQQIHVFRYSIMLQKQFIAAKMKELQKQWESHSKRLSFLENQKIAETRHEEMFRLEQEIRQEKNERGKLEKEMLRLEAHAQAEGRDVVNCTNRVHHAKTELSKRAFELLEVIQAIGLELDRMEKEGIGPADEEILLKIEGFIEQRLTKEELVLFFKTLASSKEGPEATPDYAKLAENLNKGQVVLCLGQELSHLLGAPVPSTEELIHRLVREEGFHGPLSELCEQEEILPGCCRYELVEKIRALLRGDAQTPLALYELLARLAPPLLIISAAYDDLLEQRLKNRKPFVVIYPNIREKKCLLRYSDQYEEPLPCTLEELSGQKPLSRGYTVIYKLRGGFIDQDRETLLLSERDYLNFNQATQQIPDYIRTKLKSRALWFLGHYPESWEERLLVKSIQMQRDHRAVSLAVQKDISPFAHAFWQDNHVQPFDLALRTFVQELAQEMES